MSWKCPLCGERFGEYWPHLGDVHGVGGPTPPGCCICGRRFGVAHYVERNDHFEKHGCECLLLYYLMEAKG